MKTVNELIISFCPNGDDSTKEMTPHVPISRQTK